MVTHSPEQVGPPSTSGSTSKDKAQTDSFVISDGLRAGPKRAVQKAHRECSTLLSGPEVTT